MNNEKTSQELVKNTKKAIDNIKGKIPKIDGSISIGNVKINGDKITKDLIEPLDDLKTSLIEIDEIHSNYDIIKRKIVEPFEKVVEKRAKFNRSLSVIGIMLTIISAILTYFALL